MAGWWTDMLSMSSREGMWAADLTQMYASAQQDWSAATSKGLVSDDGFLNYVNQNVKNKSLPNLVPAMYDYLTLEQNKETARLEAERKRQEEETRKKVEALQKQQAETTQRKKLSANQIKASSSVAAPKQERKNSTPILGGGAFHFGGMQLGFNDLLGGQDEGF